MVLASQTIAESLHWDPKTTSSTSTEPTDVTFTVPSGKEWQPVALRVDYISSTQAGNRQLEVQWRTTANSVLFSALPEVVQTNSSTRYYNFSINKVNDSTWVDTNKIHTQFPIDLILPENYDLRVFDNATIGTTVAPDSMTVRLHVMERDNPTTA
jgi:hypothetical protein